VRLYTKQATFILGRPRRDGYRRILAVRLTDWTPVVTLLPKKGVRTRVGADAATYVRLPDGGQRLFNFLERN
jgi:hypothetical protein